MDMMDPNPTPNIPAQPTQQPLASPPPKPVNKLFFVIGGVIILFVGLFGGYYLIKSSSKSPVKGCTLEAKICPDGSSVSRTGTSCEFTPCSQITTTPTPTPNLSSESSQSTTANWKTYTNTKYKYSFKYASQPKLKEFGCSMRVSGEKGEETSVLDEVTSSFPECAFGGYAWPISVSVEQTEPDCVNQDQAGYTVSRSEILVDGIRARKCDKTYTGAYNPNPEHIKGPSRIIEVSVPRSNQFFRLTNTNVNYLETFDQILSTFKFLDQNTNN